jgi:hypothetical protein
MKSLILKFYLTKPKLSVLSFVDVVVM